MGSAWGSSCCIARSTARAARSWPAPARTWKMRTRLEGISRGPRSVELAPASGERVRDMLDTELRSIGPPRDADHVEAHRAAEEPTTRHVERRGPGHVLPLLEIHREKGRRLI